MYHNVTIKCLLINQIRFVPGTSGGLGTWVSSQAVSSPEAKYKYVSTRVFRNSGLMTFHQLLYWLGVDCLCLICHNPMKACMRVCVPLIEFFFYLTASLVVFFKKFPWSYFTPFPQNTRIKLMLHKKFCGAYFERRYSGAKIKLFRNICELFLNMETWE